MFGTHANPGLAEYLLGEAEEHDILQRGKADNLFLIPGGRMVAGPTELIANGRFRHLLSRMNVLFDWILVDSPPATTVSDACLLSNYCDRVLMVVRARTTPFNVVRKALERFAEPALAGIVLNEIRMNPSNRGRQL
jgi:capsular exopolysaccharide synthesis family protein